MTKAENVEDIDQDDGLPPTQLRPLRHNGSSRVFCIGPLVVSVAISSDLTWATQNAENTERTEFLVGINRVTRLNKAGEPLQILEFFAGPFSLKLGWAGF